MRHAGGGDRWLARASEGTSGARSAPCDPSRRRGSVPIELLTSSPMDSVDDLQLAFDASDQAAELALAHFRSGVQTTLKADGTPVTELTGQSSAFSGRRSRRRGRKMRSSVRNSVSWVSLNGSGSLIRSTAPCSSVGVTPTGGYMWPWRSGGPRKWRS